MLKVHKYECIVNLHSYLTFHVQIVVKILKKIKHNFDNIVANLAIPSNEIWGQVK